MPENRGDLRQLSEVSLRSDGSLHYSFGHEDEARTPRYGNPFGLAPPDGVGATRFHHASKVGRWVMPIGWGPRFETLRMSEIIAPSEAEARAIVKAMSREERLAFDERGFWEATPKRDSDIAPRLTYMPEVEPAFVGRPDEPMNGRPVLQVYLVEEGPLPGTFVDRHISGLGLRPPEWSGRQLDQLSAGNCWMVGQMAKRANEYRMARGLKPRVTSPVIVPSSYDSFEIHLLEAISQIDLSEGWRLEVGLILWMMDTWASTRTLPTLDAGSLTVHVPKGAEPPPEHVTRSANPSGPGPMRDPKKRMLTR